MTKALFKELIAGKSEYSLGDVIEIEWSKNGRWRILEIPLLPAI